MVVLLAAAVQLLARIPGVLRQRLASWALGVLAAGPALLQLPAVYMCAIAAQANVQPVLHCCHQQVVPCAALDGCQSGL
jgi:hypothetical protein